MHRRKEWISRVLLLEVGSLN
ncbi:hypothetical protein CPC197_0632, partial [Chlamydia psittaci C1/97]